VSATSQGDRCDLLAAIGEVADGTLSLTDTVKRLLEIVVPAFADLALLDAIGPSGEVRRLGARVEGPARAELEGALLRRRRVVGAPVGVGHALATGQSQLLTVTEAHLEALATSEHDLELLRALQMRTALFVPLRARGRTLGVFACAVGRSGREYTGRDLRFAEVLAGRIALALDNAGLSERVTGLEQRLEAALANLAEAVLIRDPQGRMVFANQAAARLLGIESADRLAASSEELMSLYDAYDESGRRLTLDDLPSAPAERGEFPEPLLVRNVVRATGVERWLLHKATPVFNADGSLSMVVNVVEDVTEVKRAELAQRLLADAGQALASSLDYEQTLQLVAQLAVPGLADWCGVSMREGDQLEQVAVAHVDPEKVELARNLGQRFPTRLSDPSPAAEVLRTGVPRLLPELSDEMLAALEIDQERLAIIRDLHMRSVIVVPLVAGGRPPIGTLTLVMAESGRTFDPDDLGLAEELGRRAGTAVENARLYTERSRIAAALQRSLLPPELPELPGFRLASLYRAAGDQNEVGGDFYDAFAVPGGWMIVVGDVEGRGAEAAALTSLSRYTLRTAGKLLSDPIAALRELNTALRERPRLSLVTVCCAVLREVDGEAEAEIVLAGHPPAYHVRDGVPDPVGVFAPLLGVYDSAEWEAVSLALRPGDQLVLYTDGVLDTVGEHERFGEARLAEALNGAEGAADSVRRIQAAVGGFAHGPQVDDTAVLAVERAPAPETAGEPSGPAVLAPPRG